MKNSITNRYDKDSNNKLVLNISASKIKNLFEDFDKNLLLLK